MFSNGFTYSWLRFVVGRLSSCTFNQCGLNPTTEKHVKFGAWNCAFYCIRSNNPTEMQMSCLWQHARNVETVPQTVSIRHTVTHKKPRCLTVHAAMGCAPSASPWIRHCPQSRLGPSQSRLSGNCLWCNNLTLSETLLWTLKLTVASHNSVDAMPEQSVCTLR